MFAAQCLKDCRSLLVGRLDINNRLQLAVAFVHRTRPANHAGPVEPTQIHRSKLAFGDSHADHAFAVIVCRELIEITGATRIAVAVLEPRAFHEPLSCHTPSLVSRWPESCACGSGKVKHLNPQEKSVSLAHRDGSPIPAVSVILRRAMASGLAGEPEANWRHRSPRCQVSRGRALLEQLPVASRARCRFRGGRHGTFR